jgi:hypothetical protein
VSAANDHEHEEAGPQGPAPSRPGMTAAEAAAYLDKLGLREAARGVARSQPPLSPSQRAVLRRIAEQAHARLLAEGDEEGARLFEFHPENDQ